MEVKIFDTHVRTRDGRYLHFDVLVTEELGARAGELVDFKLEFGLFHGQIVLG
ncbi:DUF2024 family protein, partial [Pseudomonas aeruginosa]|uniref:DUF2024 family protein n=1 Tax=Pseudomonas aeruginosa TaxID=287 RepID=UPI0039685060